MKTAIAVKKDRKDAPLEYHFGRAPYFAIVDDNGEIRFIKNEHSKEPATKGIMTANELSKQGVKNIIAGEFGINVRPTLDILGMQMTIVNVEGQYLDEYLNNEIKQ